MFTPPVDPIYAAAGKETHSQRSRKSILCWNEHRRRGGKLVLLLAETPRVAHETTGSVDLWQISRLGSGHAPGQSEHAPRFTSGWDLDPNSTRRLRAYQGAPGSNEQSAPPPALCAIAGGSMVHTRCARLSKAEPAAPSGGIPASAMVA